MAEISKIKLPSGNTYDLKDSVARSTTEALNTALAGKQDTIDAQHKLDYSLIANTPTIPPADYVAMIDITSSTDESGNVKQSAAIVSGTFAEIDAALLAQKTVLLIGRYTATTPVSYDYFRSGAHMPGGYVIFSSIGADLIPGAVNVAVWYHDDSAGPERVEMYDGTGIMGAYPMGDGNAVTSIERHNLFPALIANKDKTFVDTAEQTLTEAQKAQARTNIGATAPEDIRQFKVLNLGNFSPSGTGKQTLGTKSEAAAALNITEAQVDSLLNGEYDYIEMSATGLGGYKIASFPPYMCDYMYIAQNENSVRMPLRLRFTNENVYSYEYKPLGINDVTVGGESVVTASDTGVSVAAIPAIPDVSNFITKSVNDLVNYYLKSEVYTKEEVASLIGAIQQFHYEIAASTSAVSDPQSNVLYLIGPSGTGSDKYEEYVYSNGWVKIGDTSIDLSGYVTGLNKGDGDNVLGESTSFTTAPSAVSFAAHTTETFVKSVSAETNKKLVTTTVPNVTSVGSASTWNFAMGTGADAETLIVSGGNGTAPTLGTEKTVATGATDANGTGSPIVTGVTVGSSAAAITALGAATAAAQTITVGTNDKVKVAKYDDLSVNKN
jgi:hypothetical protein